MTTPCSRALILSGGGARGAYQAGVWRYLCEHGWQPDLVCGTSVGAINACCIASRLEAEQLEGLWRKLNNSNVFTIRFRRRLVSGLRRVLRRKRGLSPLLSNAPLRRMLREVINIPVLREGAPEAIVTATSIQEGVLRYFGHREITVDHIMASAAIPIVFPWQRIGGKLYWDGGLMANTPLVPALQRGAREIIIVLMAPLNGNRVDLPTSHRRAAQWAYELSTIGSASAALRHLVADVEGDITGAPRSLDPGGVLTVGETRIVAVAPPGMMGMSSMLDFRPRQVEPLIDAGYANACEQLKGFMAGVAG